MMLLFVKFFPDHCNYLSMFKFRRGFTSIISVSGQVFSQNLNNRLDLTSSREGPDYEDNQYLGYSVALGDFSGNGSPDVAVGMPRGANLTGKVRQEIYSRLSYLYYILQ